MKEVRADERDKEWHKLIEPWYYANKKINPNFGYNKYIGDTTLHPHLAVRTSRGKHFIIS